MNQDGPQNSNHENDNIHTLTQRGSGNCAKPHSPNYKLNHHTQAVKRGYLSRGSPLV